MAASSKRAAPGRSVGVAGAPGPIARTIAARNAQDDERTFPVLDERLLGTAPAHVHDRYATTGPDGRRYRTWHPVSVPLDPSDPASPLVHFGHEHGDPPHVGAPPPAFGYAAFHADLAAQIADHAGFKVFTHKSGWLTGFATAELGLVVPDWDLQLCVHQGTSSALRLAQRFHALSFWARDASGRTTDVHVMADAGVLEQRGGPPRAEPGWPRRVVASHAEPDWERWTLIASVGGVWLANVTVAVANPVTHVHGDVGQPLTLELVSTASELLLPGATPLPLGDPLSAWLGQERVLYDAEWVWSASGAPEAFYTTPWGERAGDAEPGGVGSLRQRVAAIDFRSGPSGPWDRTGAALGWERVVLPVGAAGGN